MVSKYRVGYGRERQTEWFVSCGERQIQKGENDEEWGEVGELLASRVIVMSLSGLLLPLKAKKTGLHRIGLHWL